MRGTAKRSQIRAPRKPRGESAKITIANQDRQIALMIERIAVLAAERDSARSDANQAHMQRNQLIGLQDSYARLLGWQDCARELLEIERADIRIDRKSVGDMIRRAAVNAS